MQKGCLPITQQKEPESEWAREARHAGVEVDDGFL